MRKTAFIDSQNLYRAVDSQGYRIDYRRFRQFLSGKGVSRAIMFFGYTQTQRRLYDYLCRCGFELMFRDVELYEGRLKSNVDIFLTITVMDMLQANDFDSAMLVTSDGDFFDLIERLKAEGKFSDVLSPGRPAQCSKLVTRAANGHIFFFPDVKHKFANPK